jgi:hypothetical protein
MPPEGVEESGPTAIDRAANVFVSTESLTFPAATGTGVVIVQVLRIYIPKAVTNAWLALIVAFVLGVAITIKGWPSDKSGLVGKVAIAAINIVVLAGSILGINGVGSSQPLSFRSPF